MTICEFEGLCIEDIDFNIRIEFFVYNFRKIILRNLIVKFQLRQISVTLMSEDSI